MKRTKERRPDLYEKYIPIVDKHSKQIASDMLAAAVEDMKNELDNDKLHNFLLSNKLPLKVLVKKQP